MKTNIETGKRQISRRHAVRTGVALAAGALVCDQSLGQDSKADPFANAKNSNAKNFRGSVYDLPYSGWTRLIGHNFEIRGTTHETATDDSIAVGSFIRLCLTEEFVPKKVDLDRPSELGREFATHLVFVGFGDAPPTSQTYRLSHPGLGEFELFLTHTKLSRIRNQVVYSAILNN